MARFDGEVGRDEASVGSERVDRDARPRGEEGIRLAVLADGHADDLGGARLGEQVPRPVQTHALGGEVVKDDDRLPLRECAAVGGVEVDGVRLGRDGDVTVASRSAGTAGVDCLGGPDQQVVLVGSARHDLGDLDEVRELVVDRSRRAAGVHAEPGAGRQQPLQVGGAEHVQHQDVAGVPVPGLDVHVVGEDGLQREAARVGAVEALVRVEE